MLTPLQRGLELLNRVETHLDVNDFLIDEDTRARLWDARAPREQLLLAERDGDLELALFVDQRTLANLAARDPRDRLDDHNLGDFLLAVEGVSHFVYVVWRARHERQVSALELELQAEIDKYVTCLLTMDGQGGAPADLRARLFDRVSFYDDLDGEERERYQVANSNARSYAASLNDRFVARGDVVGMLAELRRFYRLGIAEKLATINCAA